MAPTRLRVPPRVGLMHHYEVQSRLMPLPVPVTNSGLSGSSDLGVRPNFATRDRPGRPNTG
eukprot:1078364-Amphidinium_carterae.2